MTVPDRVREAALREAKDAAVREAMGRLSPGAVHALRAAAKLRNSTPEEVLREELRDYVAAQIPYVDVEGIIRNMAGVFYTAGYAVGTLKGWDAEKRKMVHITDFKRREARILADGPIRTVVEMRVEGWRYGGREITMTSRYILYAGHGDVQVENRIEGDFRGLVFTTGVMKMAESEVCKNDNVIAAFGRDFPENDTVKWERESVGLAVAVPQRQIVSQTDDKTSYLFQLTPDARGRIDYAFEMIWRKSEWLKDRSDTECVLGLMESVGAARTPVVVSRIRQF